ncbi:type II toxin-antitoxin system PemK/MazF family toxin [Synechococcus sp. BA-132 BA5]|uniref:type II toxin-antitoxin system PemK/MazF family toxin n=1 Tax=Synechococcus sp. BA-132 BA5 TaxID=3110252 RepID=UPI002B2012B8|nr:type II toxin-antitoxin system PemK/MazF family toxin [Synechococcus sp. BA-132 BA5]MEA5414748.1 type II toxin-antitoxin system PemK/MazF family toxin [Synechococcus sp. BA-132 BA5]
MGPPAIGDVVLIPFPYSDLSQAKRRPALVMADVGMGDFVLCQITSKTYADRLAIPLAESDFAEGGLKRESFVRIGKLFTANSSIVSGVAGRLNPVKMSEVLDVLVDILRAGGLER